MGLSKDRARTATIADVAREAGVATMTVSRAINGYAHVKPETLRRVRVAIEKLSYSPNPAARMLMGRRSNCIALVIPELRNPFFAVVADGVQAAARKRGSLVWMVASNNDVRSERQEIEKLLSYRVDGILLIPADPGHRYLKAPFANDVPLVAIDLPIESRAADAVLVENRQSSQRAVEHLIGHGYKHILCLGGWPGLFTIRERVAGYESAMRQAALPIKVLTDPYDLAATRRAIERLVRQKERAAIFTLNQVTTEILLPLLEEMQLVIPDQIGLIGFDDFPLASLFKPKLTVVRQPASDLGACAASLLFERLDSAETSPKHRMVLLPTELVIRQSCGCTGDPSNLAVSERPLRKR